MAQDGWILRKDWWTETALGPSGPERFPLPWLLIGSGFLLPMDFTTVPHLLTQGLPVWSLVATLLLLAAYNGCYLLFPLLLPRDDLRLRLGFCAGMLALGWVLLAIVGLSGMTLLIYVLGIVAFALPVGWVLVINGGTLTLLALWLAVSGQWHEDAGDLITMLSVTVALFFMARLVRAIRYLRRANEEIATLAVAAERERLARDLHDILGHSLTTIAVKAGLARRVLESAHDPDRAITEIREVEGLARSALSDVRATVSQYREVSLSAELAGARAALRAAEIVAELPHAVDDVRPELQGIFGYVLREAVTNVLRHSGARHVRVRCAGSWLEIEDDGVVGAPIPVGNGLRGLRERLEQIGGTLTVSPRPGGGLLVRAQVPGGTAVPPDPAVLTEAVGKQR